MQVRKAILAWIVGLTIGAAAGALAATLLTDNAGNDAQTSLAVPAGADSASGQPA